MHSCIYEGWIRHRRFRPVEHSFRNKLFLIYLDLAELDKVFRGRIAWSSRRMALARFKRSDHFGDPNQPLDESVRQFVEQAGHPRPTGPIRMLAHLRYFGYAINPVSFFYCFDQNETLQYVVAEVTNTPWGETHCYVISPDQFVANDNSSASPKTFHVSPFMPMDVQYCWQMTPPQPEPNSKLTVAITNYRANAENDTDTSEPFFDAMLTLERREISTWQLSRVLMRYPLMTVQVVSSIYWQALRLWWKGCPFYSHPKKATTQQIAATTNKTDSPPADANENRSSHQNIPDSEKVEIHS